MGDFIRKRLSFIFEEVLSFAGKNCLLHGPVVVEKNKA